MSLVLGIETSCDETTAAVVDEHFNVLSSVVESLIDEHRAFGGVVGASAQLVGVTSLELLAHGAHSAGVRGTLVGCVDGRHGEVFIQTFSLEDDVAARGDPSVAVPSDVAGARTQSAQFVTFTGDAIARYESEFHAVKNATIFEQSLTTLIKFEESKHDCQRITRDEPGKNPTPRTTSRNRESLAIEECT